MYKVVTYCLMHDTKGAVQHIHSALFVVRRSNSSVAHPERALPSPASALGAKVDGRGRTITLRPSPRQPLRSSPAEDADADADPGRPADPTRNSEATLRATPPNASATLERSATSSMATRPCLLQIPLPGLNLDAAPLLLLRLTRQLEGEKYGIALSISGRGETNLQV